jgi:hypothetical protein
VNKETFKHENRGNHLISETGCGKKNFCIKITFGKTGTEKNLKAIYKTAVTGSITVGDVSLYDVFLSVLL